MNLDFSSSLRNIQLQQHLYPREIVFLGGAPGAGKGTNSLHIASIRKFDAPTIVVSDLLNTPACKVLKDRGIMVDDEFVFKTLLQELEKPIYRNGVVVDGFPRTAKQIDFIKNFHNELNCKQQSPPNISFVMLHVDETTSINRQQARGKEALMLFNAKEVRTTDLNIEASKARYTLFKEQLNTMMTRLSNEFPLIVVDASHPLDIVKADLAREISQQLDLI
jgi:adenylate kinase